MSIVCGVGSLSASVSELTTGDYTIISFFKTPDVTQYDCICEYSNAAGSYVGLQVYASTVIARVAQSFAQAPVAAGTPVNGTWIAAAVDANTTTTTPKITDISGAVSSGSSGAFTATAIPQVTVFQQRDASRPCISGVKIGMVAIYSSQLSQPAIDAIVAGGAPDSASLVALWVDNAGISKDGSDNLISWTDVIGGEILTPTGTVTVDDIDLAPQGYTGVADTTNPLIDSASAAADGASVTVNLSEAVDVGVGGSGGFTVPATYGTVTLTPTTTLPASTIVFSTSRVLQNGETISGAFAQPGNGFEDAAGNDLVSGTFAVTNGSKVHRIFSNATKDTPYTTAGVSVRLLGSIGLTDATATQTLNPDVDGYIQVAEALSTGVYAKVLSSADGTVLGIGNHTVL